METPVRVVHKRREWVAGVIPLELPVGAKILHVGDQKGAGDSLDFWFETEPDLEETEVRMVRVFGTGHLMPLMGEGWWHVGTVVTAGGKLVWHVYMEEVRF